MIKLVTIYVSLFILLSGCVFKQYSFDSETSDGRFAILVDMAKRSYNIYDFTNKAMSRSFAERAVEARETASRIIIKYDHYEQDEAKLIVEAYKAYCVAKQGEFKGSHLERTISRGVHLIPYANTSALFCYTSAGVAIFEADAADDDAPIVLYVGKRPAEEILMAEKQLEKKLLEKKQPEKKQAAEPNQQLVAVNTESKVEIIDITKVETQKIETPKISKEQNEKKPEQSLAPQKSSSSKQKTSVKKSSSTKDKKKVVKNDAVKVTNKNTKEKKIPEKEQLEKKQPDKKVGSKKADVKTSVEPTLVELSEYTNKADIIYGFAGRSGVNTVSFSMAKGVGETTSLTYLLKNESKKSIIMTEKELVGAVVSDDGSEYLAINKVRVKVKGSGCDISQEDTIVLNPYSSCILVFKDIQYPGLDTTNILAGVLQSSTGKFRITSVSVADFEAGNY